SSFVRTQLWGTPVSWLSNVTVNAWPGAADSDFTSYPFAAAPTGAVILSGPPVPPDEAGEPEAAADALAAAEGPAAADGLAAPGADAHAGRAPAAAAAAG